MRPSMEEKFIGCIIGAALGDAIGELAFRYKDRNALEAETSRAEILRYTDDTAMTIGVAESIAKLGKIDPEHMGKMFHTNYLLEPWRGYAPGPPAVFSQVESKGMSYTDAAKQLFEGKGSFGNGAAMRVAPVGLFFHECPDLYLRASHSALPTHAHPLAADGAALQAVAVAEVLELNPDRDFLPIPYLQKLISLARTPEMQVKMQHVVELIKENAPAGEAVKVLGKSVAVHESQPFALFSFLKHPGSFVDCLYCAILNGGDRDTLGAMAGALSGAYLGVRAIPESWQKKLENYKLLENLAMLLLEMDVDC